MGSLIVLLRWCCAASLVWATCSSAVTQRHVIVVGVNTSVDADTPPLSFADDDAARYAEVLGPQAASLQLLTVLDPELQRAFPALAAKAHAPTEQALRAALATAFANIEADRRRGDDADLVFIFAGHGGVSAQGEGYVSLLDARLTRSEVFASIVRPSPARFNHIIVDACSAYLLLHRGSASAALRGLLEAADLERHANTGALLATSRDQATHEWSRIRGGVFSHQVLSALAGAADVDGDDVLTYAEVGAFVEAANAGVVDQRARVDVAVSPPRALLQRPVWQLAPRDATTFVVEEARSGRITIVDGRGDIRVDLHKSAEQALAVRLFGPAPFIAVLAGREHPLEQHNESEGLRLGSAVPDALSARSSLDEALARGLYAVPFGRGYVAGYGSQLQRQAQMTTPTTTTPTTTTTAASPDVIHAPTAALFAAAGVLAGTSVVAGVVAASSLVALNTGASTLTAFEAQDLATRFNIASGVAIGGLVVGTGAAAAAWFWPTGDRP